MKIWLYRIIATAAIVEIAYLILVNLALNLPFTQTLINQHKPEKYTVIWEKAWTWHPFRVHARGISANGQTASQQWQAEAAGASASIAILPLLKKSVKIHSLVAEDIVYYQRPRPKPHKDYAATRDFPPPIRDREIDKTPVMPVPKKKGDGWKIIVEDIHASGSHRFWVFQMQGVLRGTLKANVNFETRGGPFSLDNGQMDVVINSLTINDNQPVSSQGFLKGALEFSPFVPSENRGIKSLGFMKVDAELDTRVMIPDLRVYQRYIPDKLALTLNGGQGELEGQAKLTSTSLEAGLDPRSSAADISFGDYQFMTNLDLGVNIDIPSFESGRLNISGTNIQLTDARLASQDKGKTEPWNASLSIDKGLLVLPPSCSGQEKKTGISWLDGR